MQQQCPCKIVSSGNCNATAKLHLPVDCHMYFIHSNLHKLLSNRVHLQGSSPSIFGHECFWRSVQNGAFVSCVWILPGVRCNNDCRVFSWSSIIATKGDTTKSMAFPCHVSLFNLASSQQMILNFVQNWFVNMQECPR